MPRAPVVTYEQVEAIANDLYARGTKDPGQRAIRDELLRRNGGQAGSPNTIQRHLDEWRKKARPVESQEFKELPEHLASMILGALNQAAAVGGQKVGERLTQVQAEMQELAASGEGAETRIEALAEELLARTSERDLMQGQLSERTSEVDELKTALTAATDRGGALETALHAAQTEAKEASGRVDEIRTSTDRQLVQMQKERDEARSGQAEAERRVVVAEKEAVAATAHLDGERAAKGVLEGQLADLRKEVSELKGTVARLEADAARAGAMDAQVAGLTREISRADETITMLRGLVSTGDGDAGNGTVGAGKKK